MIRAAAALAALLVALGAPAVATAAADEQAFNYEPAIAFVDGRAGQVAHARVVVRNQTFVDARFEVAVSDLRAEPGPGRTLEPVAIGDAPRGAGAWLEPDASAFELSAGTERAIDVAIRVPASAGAGGHYAAVVFTARPTDRGAQFEFDSVTSVPVLLTVEGEVRRGLRVSIEPDERLRWRGGAMGWTVRLRNEGDVHEVVAGRVRARSTFSGSDSASIPSGILLPGERRTEHVSLRVRSAPDSWRADVRIAREHGDDATARAARAWVVPWWLVALLLAGAAITAWRVGARRGTSARS